MNKTWFLALMAELKRDEGIRLKPYRDAMGRLTIGVGRNLDDVGISETESDFLLVNDIERTVATLDAHLPWWRTLDTVRQRVMTNMAFKLGMGRLLTFHDALAAMQMHQYARAAQAMVDSRWASQVGQRAVRLAEQMRTGVAV